MKQGQEPFSDEAIGTETRRDETNNAGTVWLKRPEKILRQTKQKAEIWNKDKRAVGRNRFGGRVEHVYKNRNQVS